MQVASMHFKERAHDKLHDAQLQDEPRASSRASSSAAARRRSPSSTTSRARARPRAAIRQRALDNLDTWLEMFEANATARGATVLWRADAGRGQPLVLDIARRHGVRKIIKSKSMVSEESALDHAIEGAGLTVVETDLGEYILQINDYEPPSHIIGPALHKRKDEVAELFHQKHGTPRKDDIEELCLEARGVLREHYLTADMGISGGNFFVAETGSVVLVTNEGNATLTTTLPKVHVAISGIEKIVPDAGGRRDADAPAAALGDRPVDLELRRHPDRHQGQRRIPRRRAHVLHPRRQRPHRRCSASDVREALRCIRCGACMNHCPVYQNIGGHSYGWVYPGPIGSILTPMYVGLENALDLPQASTLCNQCGVVCPVKIPLPDLQRKLREKEFERGLRPWQRARRPASCGRGSRGARRCTASRRGIGVRMLRWLARHAMA